MSKTGILFAILLSAASVQAADPIENFLGMRFVRVPAGEFVMGAKDLEGAVAEIPDPEQDALADEVPAQRASIRRDRRSGGRKSGGAARFTARCIGCARATEVPTRRLHATKLSAFGLSQNRARIWPVPAYRGISIALPVHAASL